MFLILAMLVNVDLQEMKYKDLQKTIKSSDVVMIDLWATWCIPCKQSFPTFAKFSRAHHEVKCISVSVNNMDDFDKAEKFLAKQDFRGLNVLLNEDADLIENVFKSKDEITGEEKFFIPLTLLFKKGKLVAHHVGSYEMKDLLEMLDKL